MLLTIVTRRIGCIAAAAAAMQSTHVIIVSTILFCNRCMVWAASGQKFCKRERECVQKEKKKKNKKNKKKTMKKKKKKTKKKKTKESPLRGPSVQEGMKEEIGRERELWAPPCPADELWAWGGFSPSPKESLFFGGFSYGVLEMQTRPPKHGVSSRFA